MESNGVRGAINLSRSEARDQAKETLVTGRVDYLVTSTVLERGITIRNLDVLVLKADYETIFDCRTLIQIAGRAKGGAHHDFVYWKNHFESYEGSLSVN